MRRRLTSAHIPMIAPMMLPPISQTLLSSRYLAARAMARNVQSMLTPNTIMSNEASMFCVILLS